ALRRYGTVPTDSRQSSGRSHCPPVRSSADQPRNAAGQLVGELEQLAYQPGTEKDDGEEGEQQARQEAQRLLVDLGSGLKYRYHETDQQTGHHYQRDYGGGQPECIAAQIHCYFRCHCTVSSMAPEPRISVGEPVLANPWEACSAALTTAPSVTAQLTTRGPMRRAPPSTSTNSMILNGSEMISGDSIIIPMAMSTLATTRSITRKGMKIMKPIWKAVLSSEVTKAGTRI